jgi:hypothetical protein
MHRTRKSQAVFDTLLRSLALHVNAVAAALCC